MVPPGTREIIQGMDIAGGFGSAVAEEMAEMKKKKAFLLRIGLNDMYASKVGSQQYLRRQYGMDKDAIKQKIEKALNDG